MSYARPSTLPEALHLAAQGALLLAGGTDIYPARRGSEISGPVLDLSALPDLRGITRRPQGMRIGACTSWSDIASASLPPALDALRAAAREIGGQQIQAAGTVGGNLCNASPAADGVPPLLVLDAEVELHSLGGIRRMPLGDFLTGPRRTARRPDEVLVALHLPDAALGGRSGFCKLGARSYLVISIAMVAARLVIEGGAIRKCALAVGACSAVACRLPAAEAALCGPVEGAALRLDAAQIAGALAPLDDLRASATYRAEAAVELLRRTVDALVTRESA